MNNRKQEIKLFYNLIRQVVNLTATCRNTVLHFSLNNYATFKAQGIERTVLLQRAVARYQMHNNSLLTELVDSTTIFNE